MDNRIVTTIISSVVVNPKVEMKHERRLGKRLVTHMRKKPNLVTNQAYNDANQGSFLLLLIIPES